MEVSAQRKMLVALVLDMTEEEIQDALESMARNHFGYDEDEPPLTDDELEGLRLADEDIAAGRVRPFDEALKELW